MFNLLDEFSSSIRAERSRNSAATKRMAFDPIVASGPNSALPHARPTGRTLEQGDVLVLDMGGGDTLNKDMTIMALDGRHVNIAYMADRMANIDVATLMQKRLILTGSTLRARPADEKATS